MPLHTTFHPCYSLDDVTHLAFSHTRSVTLETIIRDTYGIYQEKYLVGSPIDTLVQSEGHVQEKN